MFTYHVWTHGMIAMKFPFDTGFSQWSKKRIDLQKKIWIKNGKKKEGKLESGIKVKFLPTS